MVAKVLDMEILGPDHPGEAELESFFNECPTSFAQQTPAWRDVIAPLGPDDSHFLICRDGGKIVGALPAYRFEGPLGAILTSVPQAGPLGGIACLPNLDPAGIYETLIDGFLDLARSRQCALASVISNPFWPDRSFYEEFLRPDYVLENECQVLDLDAAIDTQGKFLLASSNLQRNLRKAESGKLRIDQEQTPDNVEQWYAIHADRHRRIGATPLPIGMFIGALDHMVPQDKACFFFVRLTDGSDEMIAGGFYVYHRQVIDALMPAMRTEFADLSPNFLLAAHTIRWAKRRGLRYYNWQGSPPDSGVYRFKKQWGSSDASYSFLTKVTGDISPFGEATVEQVKSQYPWHYVMPFDKIGENVPSSRSISTRKAAWSALAEADQ